MFESQEYLLLVNLAFIYKIYDEQLCLIWFLSHKTSFQQEKQVKFVYVGRKGLIGMKWKGSLEKEK